MRKVTKKRKTKARTKIRKYRTKTNIRKSRKAYKYLLKGGNPLYITTREKYKQIFGNTIETILKYANSAHIKHLIKLLTEEKEFPNKNTFNNNEQIDKILEPALTKFLDYIKAALPIQTLLDAYNYTKLIKHKFSSSSKEFKPTTLTAKKILNAYVSIPPDVEIDDSAIEHLPEGDKIKRRNLFIVLAGENSLIDEFIRDLQILGKISTSNTDLPAPAPLPPPRFSNPQRESSNKSMDKPITPPSFSNPQRESSNKSMDKPITPPSFLNPQRESSNKSVDKPITPSRSLSRSSSISSYNDALSSLSRSSSISSYESARTYPSTSSYKFALTSPKAIRKTSYSYLKDRLRSLRSIQPFSYLKRTIGSKKVKPKLVAIHRGGGKNYKTRNKVYSSQKKTRRHKTRRHKKRNI
jgi:hypothetical protein